MSSKVSRREASSKFLGLVVNRNVFIPALTILILSITLTLLFQDEADYYFALAQDAVSTHGGWIYTLAANVFIIFCLYIAFSKFGKIRIGGASARPEFSNWAWFSMLFSAGVGNGLVLFSIAVSVSDFLNPPLLDG